jgi:hypothetical protein
VDLASFRPVECADLNPISLAGSEAVIAMFDVLIGHLVIGGHLVGERCA